MVSLQDKVVLITGASRGIGRSIALKLAEEGAKLMLTSRSENDLQALRQCILDETGLEPSSIAYLPGSVSNPEFVEQIVSQTQQQFGRIDILINNAGIAGPVGLLQEATVEELDATIDTNLKGPLYFMKFVIPHMVNQGGGTIINVNSVAGKTAFPFWNVYCASKFGLTALTQSVTEEQRSNNIKVIGIYPGAVDTPLWETVEPHTNPDKAGMLDAEDIAETILFTLKQQHKTLIQDVTMVPLKPVL